MNVKPSADFEAVAKFPTGLAGTIGLRIIDNEGATTLDRFTAGITEYPAGSGIYQVTLTSPDTSGQYTLVWDDGNDHWATDDLVVTFSAPGEPPAGDTYADVTELARILKIRAPSVDQTAAMTRVLLAATGEINSEIDLATGVDLAGWQIALATEVCLERAVEHWKQEESPFGLVGLGAEMGSAFSSKDSWERHALKLAPLKGQWGLA